MSTELVTAIRQALADNANPEKAGGHAGVHEVGDALSGACRLLYAAKLVRAALRAHPLATRNDWLATVLDLWRNAAYREERYAAQDVSGAPQFRAFRTLEALPLYEEMVVNGAWWDLVDDVATHKLRRACGPLSGGDGRPYARMEHAIADLWKRRSSIICQVKRKEATDLALLFHCIETNLADPDFFIRKAIGWALRDLAWTDLQTVEDYVSQNANRLSALSKREALKNADTIRAGR